MKRLPAMLLIIAIIFTITVVLVLNLTAQRAKNQSFEISNSNLEISTIHKDIVAKQKESNKVVLIATGDVVPGRSVNYKMVSYNNFEWPFEKIKNILASGDITIVNFEVPLVKNCPTTVEGMVFCGREEAIKGLVSSGVDIATIANNHISDYGLTGIENTIRIMQENGIDTVGYSWSTIEKDSKANQSNKNSDPHNGEILYKLVNGTKFAFLAFNDIYRSIPPILSAEEENIRRLVGEARKNADAVVVSMHWGTEYRQKPDERQVELAHLIAEAGADLILGNHPHWVQEDEQYGNTYIKYAHGNLVFDQMWSEETRKGVIGKYTFENGKLVNKEFIPIYIVDYGQPTIME